MGKHVTVIPVASELMVPITPEAPCPPTTIRRPTTMERFEALPQETQGLAYVFRALNRPRTRHSLLAGLVSCMLLQLLVGAPYAANELAADASPALHTALRGLIIDIAMYFIFGPVALILAPTVVRGGFHPRSFISLPITLGIAVGLACIPVNGSTLGFGSIGLLTYGLTFVVFNLVLNAPFYATDEHKALQRSSGPPQMLIGGLFFGLVAAYVTLAQLYSSTLVGLLLPIGSSLTSRLAIYFLVRSFHTFTTNRSKPSSRSSRKTKASCLRFWVTSR
jgi:hypothetical protein